MKHKKHKPIVPKALLKPADVAVQKKAGQPHQQGQPRQRKPQAQQQPLPKHKAGGGPAGPCKHQHLQGQPPKLPSHQKQHAGQQGEVHLVPEQREPRPMQQPGPKQQQSTQQAPAAKTPAAAAAAAPLEAPPPSEAPAPQQQQPASKRQKTARARAAKAAAVAAVGTTTAAPGVTGGAGTAAVSSNWQAMRAVIKQQDEARKRRLPAAAAGGGPSKKPGAIGSTSGITSVLAIDCEMVGVGPAGERSALARVCVVNNFGNVLLDSYVKPKERVVDYRTRYSGVRPEHLADAMAWDDAQRQVSELVAGRTLVGHAISNDLAVLLLSHPKKLIRDTSRYPPLMWSKPGSKKRAQALRVLAQRELGLKIQEGEHSPVDDARAALYLYHKHRKDWEAAIQNGSLKLLKPTSGPLGIVRKKMAHRVDYAARDIKDDPLADL
jgi:RNA exonuclease 4